MFRPSATRHPVAALSLAAAAALLPALWPSQALAQAQPLHTGERESLEALRQTTLALIEVLVANGTLPRDKADALLAEARARAQAALAPKPAAAEGVAAGAAAGAAASGAAAGAVAAGAAAGAAAPGWGAPLAAAGKAEPPVVRVPYVPQLVRDQIRNELREEVIARAKLERWGVPNATAEWTDRIAIEGDMRVRLQADRPASGNPSPEALLAASLGGTTRAPDLAAGNAVGLATASTQDDRDRLRLRARLGFNAAVSDSVTAGLRLATGSATDRVSTNQTLGQNFNRYAFLLDRAFIKLDPADWASVSAGRFANPWFSTDLVWSDNLNFEGLAGSFKWPRPANATVLPYLTVGYFPVRESAPPKRGRHISGAQIGVQWEASDRTRVKLGLAQYVFSGFAGQVDTDYDPVSGPGRSYGQYEYEAGLRQRGNSLFLTNSPYELAAGLTPDKARWGQAMHFRPLALTAAAEFSHFAPVVVGLSAEVVRNQAFDLDEAYHRLGIFFNDARAFGAGLRATVGAAQVRNAGQWQVSLGYRWLGSDAVPDAFVDSDLGLGGTNVRGVVASVQYGLARDTNVVARVLSGRSISSTTLSPTAKDTYAVDSLQVDLNVRF